MKIDVSELIGHTAVSRESGLKLKNILDDAIKNSVTVILDFGSVKIYASPFFNTSIAPYLGEMTIDELKIKMKFENLSTVGKSLLNQVIHNAIEFYAKEEKEQINLEDKVIKGVE